MATQLQLLFAEDSSWKIWWKSANSYEKCNIPLKTYEIGHILSIQLLSIQLAGFRSPIHSQLWRVSGTWSKPGVVVVPSYY